MFHIYLVEDDIKIRTELCSFLSHYGYKCSFTEDYPEIITRILTASPDLLLLDLNLPYYDGYHICREIRRQSQLPIIIVTSRDSEVDELMSMNLGADDFITKPYNIQILLAHISSVLKRAYSANESEELKFRDIILNLNACCIALGDNTAELTKNELRILKLLIKNCCSVISREDIMNELWQNDEFVDDNTLTVNINRLRKKLETIGAHDYIITKRGLGYLIQ